MRVFFDPAQRLHAPVAELYGGQLIDPFESPQRADRILDAVSHLGTASEPRDFGREALTRVHAPDFVAFLEECWEAWAAEGFAGDAMTAAMPPDRREAHCPSHIEGRLGYFAFSGESAITSTTFKAARASANTALAAAEAVAQGAKSAFALCRPPGHHCMHAQFGGYCYLNNAALAAQAMRDSGAAQVAILDIDFHHGNGTQDIFYDRADVLFCSIHGDPDRAYPFYLGYSEEVGRGAGHGFNHNFPLPEATAFAAWLEAFEAAAGHISRFGAEALVVSLGVDIYESDPQSFFRISAPNLFEIGRRIAQFSMPTVFVMEGGYANDELGANVARVLTGFTG
ncbi:histone deacetylase family protein [Tropicimonas marinistellae]|uniref:histone deacetylase family protein n=1 Tax=Tropicimonas marinistellae TaxID=1739787 RepID=UPI00082E0DB3|nr:histone deacetylase family protein [Tropicimonas marinistellae]